MDLYKNDVFYYDELEFAEAEKERLDSLKIEYIEKQKKAREQAKQLVADFLDMTNQYQDIINRYDPYLGRDYDEKKRLINMLKDHEFLNVDLDSFFREYSDSFFARSEIGRLEYHFSLLFDRCSIEYLKEKIIHAAEEVENGRQTKDRINTKVLTFEEKIQELMRIGRIHMSKHQLDAIKSCQKQLDSYIGWTMTCNFDKTRCMRITVSELEIIEKQFDKFCSEFEPMIDSVLDLICQMYALRDVVDNIKTVLFSLKEQFISISEILLKLNFSDTIRLLVEPLISEARKKDSNDFEHYENSEALFMEIVTLVNDLFPFRNGDIDLNECPSSITDRVSRIHQMLSEIPYMEDKDMSSLFGTVVADDDLDPMMSDAYLTDEFEKIVIDENITDIKSQVMELGKMYIERFKTNPSFVDEAQEQMDFLMTIEDKYFNDEFMNKWKVYLFVLSRLSNNTTVNYYLMVSYSSSVVHGEMMEIINKQMGFSV